MLECCYCRLLVYFVGFWRSRANFRAIGDDTTTFGVWKDLVDALETKRWMNEV